MKENSIEEDMKLLEKMKNNCFIKRKYIDIEAEKKGKAIEHILSDYKRVLKENELYRTELNCTEQLKRENEELKYKYDKALTDVVKETEKKKIEGRKNGKTIELAMKLREEILNLPQCRLYGIKNCKNRTVLLTREEVIQVQKIKDKIEEKDKVYRKILCKNGMSADKFDRLNKLEIEVEVLQELIEESEEK